jgi:hypothetical protein
MRGSRPLSYLVMREKVFLSVYSSSHNLEMHYAVYTLSLYPQVSESHSP